MKKITTTLTGAFAFNQGWATRQGMFNSLFAKLTSYDIMFEGSRRDIAPGFIASLQCNNHKGKMSLLAAPCYYMPQFIRK